MPSYSLENCSFVELFYRKDQIPVLSPYNVSLFYGETLEFLRIQILVILRMWMGKDKRLKVHLLR